MGKKVTALRHWIEKAMQDEHMHSQDTSDIQTEPSAQNLVIPGVAMGGGKPPKKPKT